jgi:hypothetical protein
MTNGPQSLDHYSFQEGFLAGIEINRDTGTTILEFNAVPLRPGHPDFSQVRLAENQKMGLLYSNEDARNVDLRCSGCTFHTVSWDPKGKLAKSEQLLDLNGPVDKFEITSSGSGQTIELVSQDIRLIVTCTGLELAEARIRDTG